MFREPEKEEFVFRGCQSILIAMMISTSRAKHMMSRGSVAFLAAVIEMPTAVPRLENIPVVPEFSDVHSYSPRVSECFFPRVTWYASI